MSTLSSNAHKSNDHVIPRQLAPSEGELLQFLGSRVRILADGASTGGRCTMLIENTPHRGGPPLHRHGVDDELFYVLKGRYKFVRDGETFIAEPGAFVACPRNSVHTFLCLDPDGGSLLVVTTPAGLERPFRECHNAETQGPLTPEQLTAIFAKFNLAFVGPPLTAE